MLDRSPFRIDFAGGWTDTPPYSVIAGGEIVNICVEFNGQPQLQAFAKVKHNSHSFGKYFSHRNGKQFSHTDGKQNLHPKGKQNS